MAELFEFTRDTHSSCLCAPIHPVYRGISFTYRHCYRYYCCVNCESIMPHLWWRGNCISKQVTQWNSMFHTLLLFFVYLSLFSFFLFRISRKSITILLLIFFALPAAVFVATLALNVISTALSTFSLDKFINWCGSLDDSNCLFFPFHRYLFHDTVAIVEASNFRIKEFHGRHPVESFNPLILRLLITRCFQALITFNWNFTLRALSAARSVLKISRSLIGCLYGPAFFSAANRISLGYESRLSNRQRIPSVQSNLSFLSNTRTNDSFTDTLRYTLKRICRPRLKKREPCSNSILDSSLHQSSPRNFPIYFPSANRIKTRFTMRFNSTCSLINSVDFQGPDSACRFLLLTTWKSSVWPRRN